MPMLVWTPVFAVLGTIIGLFVDPGNCWHGTIIGAVVEFFLGLWGAVFAEETGMQ